MQISNHRLSNGVSSINFEIINLINTKNTHVNFDIQASVKLTQITDVNDVQKIVKNALEKCNSIFSSVTVSVSVILVRTTPPVTTAKVVKKHKHHKQHKQLN